mgnify:CR=1 FL=1
MGALDHARARITARIGALFLTQLDQRVLLLPCGAHNRASAKNRKPR